LAMAKRFLDEGMKVVIADIEETALDGARATLASSGGDVLAVPTDVAKTESVEDLADRAFAQFGGVHVLCNNAGVSEPGLMWENSLEDWQWVMGVNLWGVIHGIRAFLPRMIAQEEEGHVVNTAAMAGLTSMPMMGIYNVTKQAVVGLSETLYHDLRIRKHPVGVSVLCPGWVNTNIAESDRNRPEALKDGNGAEDAFRERFKDSVRSVLSTGTAPDDIAGEVLEAMRESRFYVLPHKDMKDNIELRMKCILEETDPRYISKF